MYHLCFNGVFMPRNGLERILEILNHLMCDVLDLGQSSMTEHQFKAFRKMTLDRFADARKEMGRCGENKMMARKDVPYE